MRRFGVRCGEIAVLVVMAAGLCNCAATRKLAVGSMVPILENTAAAARERDDLDTVGAGYPANLLLLDGLIRTDPKNASLLALGSSFYFGYALGFVEGRDPKRASEYYAKGRDYGLRALERKSAFRAGRTANLEKYKKGVAALTKNDVTAMAWGCANWGRWLSLNLDSPAAIAEMPRLEALLDRLLVLGPDFERGLPHALRGSYDALRPEMFGGNPQHAREHFEAALRISQRKMLLYLVFYAEFYCHQVLDEACFDSTLAEVAAAPDSLLPDARLLNEIAKRRAAELAAHRDELF
jgi:hypothetical protein